MHLLGIAYLFTFKANFVKMIKFYKKTIIK